VIHAFTQRLATRIAHPDAAAIEHTLVDAGEIIRIWAQFGGDATRAGAVGPLSEPIEYPSVSAEDAARLNEALVSFVRSHPLGSMVCSAIHGLTYLATPEIKPLLIEVLRDSLTRDWNTLYQTMLTLEAVGAHVFGDVLSTGCDDVEQNQRRARQYLTSHANAT
jgi:hypothetical protein